MIDLMINLMTLVGFATSLIIAGIVLGKTGEWLWYILHDRQYKKKAEHYERRCRELEQKLAYSEVTDEQ